MNIMCKNEKDKENVIDYVYILLNDGKSTILKYELNSQVIEWLSQLPIELFIHDENYKEPYKLTTFLKSLLRRLKGAAWGACEGAATGVATGCNVSGAGWWISGTVCQLLGAFAGLVIGTYAFAILGFLSDADRIRELLSDYRHAFGRIENNDRGDGGSDKTVGS